MSFVRLEPTVKTEPHHPKHGLAKYSAAHLACAENSVYKDDWHFYNLEAVFVCRKLHLNLERISLETNLVEVDGLENLSAIALESGCRVVNLHSRNYADVLRCEIRHQHSAHRPVYHIHAAHLSRADGNIVSINRAGIIKSRQVLRIVAEIGIHLKNIVVTILYCPLKAGDVCCTKSQFASSFNQK